MRPRLVDRLRAGPEIKLTVVAAPAGSGKTTLLGSWREAQEGLRPVAWLTLDEGDSDPVVLWSYVLAALRDVCPSLAVSSSPERLGAARTLENFLPELINALIEIGDVALVLDDFHRLSSGDARDSVAWFIDHAPATFQLVLATRNEPALALGVAPGPRGPASSYAPTSSASRGPRPICSSTIASSSGSSAGTWTTSSSEPKAGRPASTWQRFPFSAVEDRHGFVSSFGGKSRHVVDFLVDEVLEAHDPATQDADAAVVDPRPAVRPAV